MSTSSRPTGTTRPLSRATRSTTVRRPCGIARGRHDPRRLVEEDVGERLPRDLLPVQRDDVVRADDRVQPPGLPVHGDAPRLDELVRLAARRDARPGQERVQPHPPIIGRATAPGARRPASA